MGTSSLAAAFFARRNASRISAWSSRKSKSSMVQDKRAAMRLQPVKCQSGWARNHAFSLQLSSILHGETVRAAVFTLALLSLATAGYAQEQERKLVDRLLSPDTKLSNPEQNKKF